MREISKRLLAFLLTAAMVFGLSGLTAFAAETDAEEPAAIADAKEYDVKYAVTLWGINQDTDESGYTLGLTFGPATGADYRDTYEAHISESDYEAGGICLHWMSWEEIARQSRIDPTVFENCLEYGCTHSVDLVLNEDLLETSYAGKMDDGDGAGMLRYSVQEKRRYWNSEADNTSGWPASQVRAVLNGKDELTIGYAKYALDESNCLFSCFPEDLQDAIVAKAVASDTLYDRTSSEFNQISYDKLWLFSRKEVYVNEGSDSYAIRSQEGKLYQRSELFGISISDPGRLMNYYEEDTFNNQGGNWWMRTLPMQNSSQMLVINPSGATGKYDCTQTTVGLAPGFCLAGPADKTELIATIEAAEALQEEDYTPATWEVFEEALAAAYGILDKEDATQKEVDDAVLDLQDAMDGLEAPADKTELEEAIAAVEAAMSDLHEEDYTPASWAALEESLAYANALMEDRSATQDEVEAAREDLLAALDGLVKTADRTELDAVIAEAEALLEYEYTTESWEVLEEALANAKAVADDPNASQEEVNAARDALETAMDSLESAPVEAFAVYSAEDASLTFYTGMVPKEGDIYQDKEATTVYTDVDRISTNNTDGIPWYDLRESVTAVVIDASFADARPVSLAFWFDGYENASFTGLEYMDTSNVTSMYDTFYGCSALTAPDVSDWDTGNVTTMYGMFRDCTNLTGLDLAGWDTESLTTMQYMFRECDSLTDLDLSGWDVSGVTSMNSMFYNCKSLTRVGGLSDWDTSANTTMQYMFTECTALTELDLSGWDTAQVTTMSQLFYDCSSLTCVGDLSDWDTGNVTTMYGMFYHCSDLTSLDVSNWDTGCVTTMQYMFRDCSLLTDVDVADWDTANVTEMGNMFRNCTSFTSLDLSGWDTTGVTGNSSFATGCSALEWVKIGEKTNIFTMGQCITQKNWYDSPTNGTLVSSNYLQDVTEPGQYWTDTDSGTTVPVDKTGLTATIAEAKSLDAENYTAESWTLLEETLAAAEAIAGDENATQGEVDAVRTALQDAMDALEEQKPDAGETADKTDLTAAIETAEALLKDEYTEETWEILQNALAAAQAVEADADATQDDVTEATEALTAAIEGLKHVEETSGEEADKAGLEKEAAAVEAEINGLTRDDYTDASWQALTDALAVAQAVLDDPDATQEEVDDALLALDTARENLTKKTDTTDPEPDPTPGEDYTGFVQGTDGHDYYMENGVITGTKQGILRDDNNALGDAGAWYYVIDSEVQYGFTGLSNFGNENGWWYIVKGKVDFDHNGVDKNQNGWWYVTDGRVQFDFTGLANYANENGWWYIVGGQVDFNHNGVDRNVNGWWYVLDGKVQFGFTGLANYSNENGWWYIVGGQVDFNHNGVDRNVNGWWYVTGGKVQFGFTGLANYANENGWWVISNGKVDFTFNGVASNNNGTWYIRNGKVDFSYNGTVTTSSGRRYTIVNGKAT